jgi:hypothetical protein
MAPSFLLFARSEAIRGDEPHLVAERLARHRWLRFVAPVGPDSPPVPREGPESRGFPGEVGLCVRLAVEIAESKGIPLRVIDLAAASEDLELIAKWVRPETVLPLLISPNGESLEGPGWFVPAELRHFLGAR